MLRHARRLGLSCAAWHWVGERATACMAESWPFLCQGNTNTLPSSGCPTPISAALAWHSLTTDDLNPVLFYSGRAAGPIERCWGHAVAARWGTSL